MPYPRLMSTQHFRTQKGSPSKIERAPAQKKIVKRHNKYDKNVYPRVSVVYGRRKVSCDHDRSIICREEVDNHFAAVRHKQQKKDYADRKKVSCHHERSVIDIDREDVNNPLAAVEYVQDLYRFYKLAESSIQVKDYMYLQSDIDEGLRMKLVDLMVGAHRRLELAPEILYLAVQIVDRYVAMNLVTRNEFQLVGLTALVLASKYEEDFVPAARPIEEYVSVADGAFSKQQILAMEKSILEKLGWTFSVPTMYQFLIRFIKAAVADKEMENTVFFFGELCLMQYGMLRYSPSLLAASAVYTARCTLEKTPFWDETLMHYTGYSQYQILECAKQLSRFHSKIAGHELRETFRKYLSCERDVVSLLQPAPSLRFD